MPKPLTASLAVLFLAAFAAWSADGLGRFDFERLPGEIWGANMCRTQQNPPREADRFATWSPLLRGRFAQPDLFGQILFAE